MKLNWVPPGFVLAEFPKQAEETSSGLIIPDSAKDEREKQAAKALLVGAPKPKEGGLFDLGIQPGEVLWVHPRFGSCWRKASSSQTEIRLYTFEEVQGRIDQEAADY